MTSQRKKAKFPPLQQSPNDFDPDEYKYRTMIGVSNAMYSKSHNLIL